MLSTGAVRRDGMWRVGFHSQDDEPRRSPKVCSRMKPDTSAEIDAELNAAKAKYGSNDFELLCLEGSRGDTLDDEQLLLMLRHFNKTGSAYGRIVLQTEKPSLWRRFAIRIRGAIAPWLVER